MHLRLGGKTNIYTVLQVKHSSVLLGQFLLIILSVIIGIVPLFSDGKIYSAALIFLHILIVLWCCGSLFSSPRKPYSLFVIVHVFSLFFFGIAPILQYNNMVTFWGAARLPETAYIQTSSTILAILVLYNIVYAEIYHRVKIPSIFLRMAKKLELKNYSLRNRLSFRGKHVMLLLGVVVFLLIFYSYDFNVIKLFFRGVLDDFVQSNGGDSGNALYLIMSKFIRPMSIALFLTAKYYDLRPRWVTRYLLILMLLSVFPTGIPRFLAAALYMPVLFILFPKVKRPNIFVLVLVLGLLVIFPLLDVFRYFDSNQGISIAFNFDMFQEGHFDSYVSFAQIIYYDIVTYGRQLLGVFLFFVPRSIWHDKPIGSGAELAEQLNFSFTNISCNYFAEGYCNFGMLGVLLFVLVLAFLTAAIDKLYWRYTKYRPANYFNVVYLVLLGLLFFVLRGDLMSSFAFTIAILCSFICIFCIVKRCVLK